MPTILTKDIEKASVKELKFRLKLLKGVQEATEDEIDEIQVELLKRKPLVKVE